MGAAASGQTIPSAQDRIDAEQKALFSMQKDGGFQGTFAKIDADASGQLDKAEFVTAAKSLGMEISSEECDELFKTLDASGDGMIDATEFLEFVKGAARQKGVLVELPPDTSEIVSLLGPHEASTGFQRALLTLRANPLAATVPMPDSDWLPIHCILMMGNAVQQTTSASKKAADKAMMDSATTLLRQVIEAHPEGCQRRIMVGGHYPRGHLPLFLACTRGWSLEVVQMLLKGWPEAAETMDPLVEPKNGKAPPQNPKKSHTRAPASLDLSLISIKASPSFLSSRTPSTFFRAGRYARKIAEEAEAPPEVLALLPVPKKKKGAIVWTLDSAAAGKPKKTAGKKK